MLFPIKSNSSTRTPTIKFISLSIGKFVFPKIYPFPSGTLYGNLVLGMGKAGGMEGERGGGGGSVFT